MGHEVREGAWTLPEVALLLFCEFYLYLRKERNERPLKETLLNTFLMQYLENVDTPKEMKGNTKRRSSFFKHFARTTAGWHVTLKRNFFVLIPF